MNLIFLFLGFFLSALAQGACNNLTISNISSSSPGGDTINVGNAKTITVQLTRSGGNSCNWFLTMSNGNANSFSNRRLANGIYSLPIQIYTDIGLTQIFKNFPDIASSNNILSGSFPNGSNPESLSISFYANLSNIDYARFGYYSDSFAITLYDGTYAGAHTALTTVNKTFSHMVAKLINLSLVDTGAPFSATSLSKAMNFGILSEGKTQAMDLVLKFNAGYKILFSSQNNGALKNAQGNDTVPYAITVNSAPVNLQMSSANAVVVGSGVGISSSVGQRFAVSTRIGALGAARAGNYADTITITVQTNE